MMLDADMAVAMAKHSELVSADGGQATDVAGKRAQLARLTAFWNEGAPAVETVEDLTIPTTWPMRARLFRPRAGETAIVVFVHGGGWQQGSIDASEWHSRGLATESGLAVLSVSYRLAPEHPFPSALDDVVAAIRWCAAGGLGPTIRNDRILLSGASAGANLALGATLRLRDENGPMPLALALYYGVFGDDFDTESYRTFADGRFGLSRAGMQDYFGTYLPGGSGLPNPYAVPIKADLAGLPGIWLGTAELDVLRDDSLRLERRLHEMAIKVETTEYAGLTHGFCNRARMVPKARLAIADGARFLARAADCR